MECSDWTLGACYQIPLPIPESRRAQSVQPAVEPFQNNLDSSDIGSIQECPTARCEVSQWHVATVELGRNH